MSGTVRWCAEGLVKARLAMIAACLFLVCPFALGELASEIVVSDRHSAIERWAPDPGDMFLAEKLREIPRGAQAVYLGGSGKGGSPARIS